MKKILICITLTLCTLLLFVSCKAEPQQSASDTTASGGGNETALSDCHNGHTATVKPAVAPTCTETGLTEGKHCSVCGEVTAAQDTVDALGHNWVSATTEAPRTCLDCGATEGEKLPELTPDPDSTPDPDPDPDPDDEEEKEMSIFERIWQAILDFFNKIVEFFKGFSKDSNKDK